MEEKVKELMSVMFAIDVETISHDSTMQNTKGWDSLSNMNLMLMLEQECGVKFSDNEITDVKKYNDITDLITLKLNSGS